jgi:hypothetical protein
MYPRSSSIGPETAKCHPLEVKPLPDHGHLTQHCEICEMWSANPLGHLQSLVRSPKSIRSLHIDKPIDGWKSGAERGCVLCNLVTNLCQDLEILREFDCTQEIQVLVSPVRQDFPHFIEVVGFKSRGDVRVKSWEVELYATKGKWFNLP